MCDVRSLPAALGHPLLDQVPVDHMKGWGGLGAINDTPSTVSIFITCARYVLFMAVVYERCRTLRSTSPCVRAADYEVIMTLPGCSNLP